MPAVTNIAAYKFAVLGELKPLREELTAFCRRRVLKGTILLSTEGINLFVAGSAESVDALLARLRDVPGLEDLTPKFSESTHQPFTRMLVRIKKEIIAFGVEGIEPARRTSPKLAPTELKRWLDEGRPVTLLDTRNDYEVKLGTFRGAHVLDIDHFREFPKAVAELSEAMKREPIVMFCTGGIRCEKAGPFMEREGFENVFQLDGGILKYFEDCGGAHYDGECFVFDQRVGVDPALRESESTQCYVCQTPLTPMDQRDARYIAGRSCPYCHRPPIEELGAVLARRQEMLLQISNPLPGSAPYENRRPVRIPKNFDGRKLIEFLTTAFPHLAVEVWQDRCDAGRFLNADETAAHTEQTVRAGERYLHLTPGEIEPPVNPAITLMYEDEAIVVLDKAAPLPVHPSGRFNHNTLVGFLNAIYAPERPRPAHRLDANTTGVMVCARTRHYARLLQPQFEAGEVEKRYLARVIGHPAENASVCNAPISAGPGPHGTREPDASEDGLPAETRFHVLRRDSDGTALLDVRPLTGRTNQIRVHLWSLGLPIVGDPAYLPNAELGAAMTLLPHDPPMCLHAAEIKFRHPASGDAITFEAPAPAWA